MLFQQKENKKQILEGKMMGIVIQNCLWIINKDGEKQLLWLNKPQRRLLRIIQNQLESGLPVRVIILKARQEGMSTLIAAVIYLKCICEENTSAGIIADMATNSEQLFQMYKRFYENAPQGFIPPIRYDRRDVGVVFGEGIDSRIDIMVASEAKSEVSGKTGRSKTYRLLHRSEIAFWNNPRATMNALNQTVPDSEGTMIFDESTANGWGDDFHTDWERAMSGKSEFEPLFLPWHEHDEYSMPFSIDEERKDLENNLRDSDDDVEWGNELALMEKHKLSLERLHWRRRAIRTKCAGNLLTFMREYPSDPDEAFQMTGQPGLDRDGLRVFEIKNPLTCGDIEKRNVISITEKPYGFVRLWEYPEEYVEYIIGSDHAQGLDWHDFNYAVVLRRVPLQIVAELSGYDGRRIQPDEFGRMMGLLAEFYNQAWICPESNLDGGKAITVLEREMGYPKLIFEDQLGLSKVHRAGWSSNTNSRRAVISELQEVIKEKAIDIWSELTIRCARSFSYINGKLQAAKKGQDRQPGDPIWQYIDDPLFALGSALLAHKVLPMPKPVIYQKLQPHQKTHRLWERQKQQEGILAYI